MILALALSLLAAPPIPAWMSRPGADAVSYRRGAYNFAIHGIPRLARDMYGTGVGHAVAYEALATGRAANLETTVYDQIQRALKTPPGLPIDENVLSPVFSRRYGSLEKVFDWAHTLHFQTIDVLMHPGWTEARRDQEIERLWTNYQAQPFAITGLPMNMDWLDSMPYSARFRTKYPKVNGLFWGYHWLQTSVYDMLFRVNPKDQAPQYEVLGDRYHAVELLKTNREVMPMTAELSPRFSKRFPHIANAFDNLHMLHDNVNDILASGEFTSGQKKAMIDEAIVRVLASTHQGETAGTGEARGLHDHRHPPSQPGMGWMRGMEDDVMYMSGMGWMDMSVCSHCSVPLPEGPIWGATVSADGWTMTVRCLMCARDMAAETPGRAIIRAATEDPNRLLVLISDDEGNLSSNIPGVVFLEEMGEHPECTAWSRAFTSRAAFDRFVAEHPEFKSAEPFTLAEWQKRNAGRPMTYRKIDRPSPYIKPGGGR
jgi:hypothetical protein